MSEIKPPPNWCPTCDKRPNDPEAVFCSDSFHRREETQVADILTRVSKALPVLRNILANGKLAGADIAQEMLDDINAILARAPQPVTPAGGEVRFPRVETGVVQFGDDWPGVFIRGDNAAATAMNLRCEDPTWRNAAVKAVADLLESCHVARNPDIRHIPTHPPASDSALATAGNKLLAAMNMQEGREDSYFHITAVAAKKIWDEAKAAWDAALNQRGGA